MSQRDTESSGGDDAPEVRPHHKREWRVNSERDQWIDREMRRDERLLVLRTSISTAIISAVCVNALVWGIGWLGQFIVRHWKW